MIVCSMSFSRAVCLARTFRSENGVFTNSEIPNLQILMASDKNILGFEIPVDYRVIMNAFQA
jgi:hypothetical protein